MSTEIFRKYMDIINESMDPAGHKIAAIATRMAQGQAQAAKAATDPSHAEAYAEDAIDLATTAKGFSQSMEAGLIAYRRMDALAREPFATAVEEELGINLEDVR